MLRYQPLWETMRRQGVGAYALIHPYHITPRTVNNVKHGKSITMYTLETLCSILQCAPNDVVEFLPDPEL